MERLRAEPEQILPYSVPIQQEISIRGGKGGGSGSSLYATFQGTLIYAPFSENGGESIRPGGNVFQLAGTDGENGHTPAGGGAGGAGNFIGDSGARGGNGGRGRRRHGSNHGNRRIGWH